MLHQRSSALQGRSLSSRCASGVSRNHVVSRRSAVAARATLLTGFKPATSSPKKKPSNKPGTLWGARLTSTTPLVGDSGTKLTIKLVDAKTDERTEAYSIDDWEPPQEITIDGIKGWTRCGVITVPDSLTAPSAIAIKKANTSSAQDGQSLDYISEVELTSPFDGVHKIPVHSWVSSVHGDRLFFEGAAFLPKDTPEQIKDEREDELKALKGKGGPSSDMRTYDYQVYDDLGPNRPNLGGSTTLPYPRRLKTKGPGKDNLPYDEQFNYSKQTGFNGDTLAGVAVAFTQTLSAAAGQEPAWYNLLPIAAVGIAKKKLGVTSKAPEFRKYEDVMTLYKPTDQAILSQDQADEINEVTTEKELGLIKASAVGKTFLQQQQEKLAAAGKQSQDKLAAARNSLLSAASASLPSGSFKEVAVRAVSTLKGDASSSVLDINDLLAYKTPKVDYGRHGQWASDLEFGRQTLAGMNPCMLSSLKQMPSEMGSAIEPKHVDEYLKELDPKGRGMQQLVADAAAGGKPQLFIIDYWVLNAFWGEFNGAKDRAEHVGRALFYLQQKDGVDAGMLPVAIELAHRGNIKGTKGVVYSRQELCKDKKTEVMWRLAKAVFRSVDSGCHQLVSHWLRCHACLEPFMIALRRNISIMHPVSKLMIPHFRYTLNINCNARSALINENGTIESAFTPGPYAIRLSSAAYKFWRFAQQALPAELESRGMLKPDGKPWLDDYPYAQDGLDLWNAYTDYFSKYLKLYYKSDADVVEDKELQGWWEESKNQGHVDVLNVVKEQLTKAGKSPAAAAEEAEKEIWGFNGPIPTVDKLVWILATIAWTASGHHAAVNFGQYDYSGLMLNASSMVRRPIPSPDNTSDPAYKALVDKSGDAQEGELLTYMSDFTSTLKVMTTVKLLSSHADDEQTIDEPNSMITDPAAVALNHQFINRMKALEMKFINRNRDAKNWTRVAGKPEALEYTLLYPSSGAGVTMRGVPYSVSI